MQITIALALVIKILNINNAVIEVHALLERQQNSNANVINNLQVVSVMFH